jgi:hypothetical protein
MSGKSEKQTIKFKAVKVVQEPTRVSFTTKDGQKVTFKATKAVEKPVIVKFQAKPKK